MSAISSVHGSFVWYSIAGAARPDDINAALAGLGSSRRVKLNHVTELKRIARSFTKRSNGERFKTELIFADDNEIVVGLLRAEIDVNNRIAGWVQIDTAVFDPSAPFDGCADWRDNHWIKTFGGPVGEAFHAKAHGLMTLVDGRVFRPIIVDRLNDLGAVRLQSHGSLHYVPGTIDPMVATLVSALGDSEFHAIPQDSDAAAAVAGSALQRHVNEKLAAVRERIRELRSPDRKRSPGARAVQNVIDDIASLRDVISLYSDKLLSEISDFGSVSDALRDDAMAILADTTTTTAKVETSPWDALLAEIDTVTDFGVLDLVRAKVPFHLRNADYINAQPFDGFIATPLDGGGVRIAPVE